MSTGGERAPTAGKMEPAFSEDFHQTVMILPFGYSRIFDGHNWNMGRRADVKAVKHLKFVLTLSCPRLTCIKKNINHFSDIHMLLF